MMIAFTALLVLLGFGIPSIPSNGGSLVTSTPPPGSGSVVLIWTELTSATNPVTGYNVYRSTGACFAPPSTKLNGSPVSLPSYLDSSVSSSATYCYAMTALNGSLESVQSSPVQVNTP